MVARTPNGLPAAGQLVSAYDLALIARQALGMPAFMRYDQTLAATFSGTRFGPVDMVNQNALLTQYRGGIGGKIGWTPAGATYIGMARRNGVTLIVTILHATPLTEITSAEQLLNWGFAMNGAGPPGRHAGAAAALEASRAHGLPARGRLAWALVVEALLPDRADGPGCAAIAVKCGRSIPAGRGKAPSRTNRCLAGAHIPPDLARSDAVADDSGPVRMWDRGTGCRTGRIAGRRRGRGARHWPWQGPAAASTVGLAAASAGTAALLRDARVWRGVRPRRSSGPGATRRCQGPGRRQAAGQSRHRGALPAARCAAAAEGAGVGVRDRRCHHRRGTCAKDAHGLYPPASTLKVLTAITMLPRLSPNATVLATKRAASVEPNIVGIVPGHRYKVADLFNALLLISANDAAVALVQASGSFARGMDLVNAEAQHLQAYDVVAKQPNGLPAAGQVVSAYDLALIARQALAMPAFMGYDSRLTARFPISGTRRYAGQPELPADPVPRRHRRQDRLDHEGRGHLHRHGQEERGHADRDDPACHPADRDPLRREAAQLGLRDGRQGPPGRRAGAAAARRARQHHVEEDGQPRQRNHGASRHGSAGHGASNHGAENRWLARPVTRSAGFAAATGVAAGLALGLVGALAWAAAAAAPCSASARRASLPRCDRQAGPG